MFNTCEKCGSDKNKVTNSREREKFIIRQRKCVKCSHTWSTREISDDEFARLTSAKKSIAENVKVFVENLTAEERADFLNEISKSI